MSRGARYERRLVRALTASRFGAVRIPTSGSGTDADLPDVLASRRVQLHRQPSPRVSVDDGDDGALRTLSDAWAIEVKSGSQTTLYADEAETIDELLEQVIEDGPQVATQEVAAGD